jgi:hypothetical protein
MSAGAMYGRADFNRFMYNQPPEAIDVGPVAEAGTAPPPGRLSGNG